MSVAARPPRLSRPATDGDRTPYCRPHVNERLGVGVSLGFDDPLGHARVIGFTVGVDKIVLAEALFKSLAKVDYDADTGALTFDPGAQRRRPLSVRHARQEPRDQRWGFVLVSTASDGPTLTASTRPVSDQMPALLRLMSTVRHPR